MANPKSLLLADIIDTFTIWVGKSVAWFTVIMAVVIFVIVIARKVFDWGSIALQDSVTYMHATVFLLAAAYTLKQDGHVRVDIFYRQFSPNTKAWINSLGQILFLLPFSFYWLIVSWPFVETSWRIHEVSPNPGGIPAVFLLKSLIPMAALLLILQGIAELLRNIKTLCHLPPSPENQQLRK